MPMTEDKRRELAQMKADEARAKKIAVREKRKTSKAKKS
jgi:ribosome recycling factor